jgi:hypothetical protein
MMGKWLLFLVTLLAAGLLGWRSVQPPAPLGGNAPAAAFSATRAMTDVREMARAPHPTGSAENARVRGYLVARLEALGFTVRQIETPLPEKSARRLQKWGGDPKAVAVSLIATRPGRDSNSPAVAVMAHYDSVWGSPGAADDAAGVASALEIARAIPQRDQARDLVLLLTDAEELGLVGANAIFGAEGVTADPVAGRIGALVNLEARGGGGLASMFETGPGNGETMRLFKSAVAHPAANSLAVKIYELLPNGTDFTPAKQRGIQGVNFAFIGDAHLYHSPLATPERLDQAGLQHLGGQGLDITRALVTAPALPKPAADLVFSDVLGHFIIAYPPVWGWALIAVSAAAILIIIRRSVPQRRWRDIGLGMLDALVFAMTAAVLLYGGNLLSGADAPTNYYDRLAALPRLEGQALLLMLAGLALATVIGGTRPRRLAWWGGAALFTLAMATAVQALLPAGGPVLAWPLTAISLAMLLTVHSDAALERPAALLLPAAAAIFGLAFAGGLAHFVLLGIGISTPSAVAVFAPLALTLLGPLLPRLSRRAAVVLALAAIGGAAGLALSVRLDGPAVSIPPYSDKS